MLESRPVSMFVLAVSVGIAAGGWLSGAERGTRCRISTTAPVTISLPLAKADAEGQHLYRNAAGQWVPLDGARQVGNTLTFTLDPAGLEAGRTTVVMGKPDWLHLDDTTAPVALRVVVDGQEIEPAPIIDLGWIDTPPHFLRVELADDRNPLNAASVAAMLGERRVAAGSGGLRFEPDPADAKKGVVSCDLVAVHGAAAFGTSRIILVCDDLAADSNRFEMVLSYTVTGTPEITLEQPNAIAPNGSKIFVDSIFSGYENVECLVDGKEQEPGTSTGGSTWASAESAQDHWVCVVLPTERRLNGLAITWAHFQGTHWTALRYDIMTWDGQTWQRALRVDSNPEARTSVHTFKDRSAARVLIWVPAGGNHPQRPNLTWITEVTFLP